MTGPLRRWRRRLAGPALLLASLSLLFVVLEIACRIALPGSPPGTTYGKEVRKNSLGLRDRDFAIPKPPGVARVVVLGDSFTWGVGLDVEESLPKVLETELAARGARVEVVNAAVPGCNTVQELMLLQTTGLRYQPDLVVVIYNLNDIEYLPELSGRQDEAKATPVVEIDPGEDVTRYSRNAGLRGLLLVVERRSVFVRFLVPRVGTLLRRAGILESVEFSWVEKLYQGFTDDNPGWLESKRSLAGIAEVCRHEGCRVLVAVYPLFAELEDYKGKDAHETILRFCRERGIPAIDLLPLFAGTRTTSHWINFMDSHPDAEAHRTVAERLLPEVLDRLPGAQAPVEDRVP